MNWKLTEEDNKIAEQQIIEKISDWAVDHSNWGEWAYRTRLEQITKEVYAQAQAKKIHDWGNEGCPHSKERYLRPKKHECHQCWQSLKEAGEK